MEQWEVWKAKFPYEEDPSIIKVRPVIILNVEPLEVLSVKVTSHEVREKDDYDTPIVKWKEAGLERASIARISKTMNLSKGNFISKYGKLHIDDQKVIMERFMKYINN